MIATRPELKLLLYCAKVKIFRHDIDIIKTLLQQNLDWEYLLTTAKLHKVAPLLYVNLINIAPQAVPKDVIEKLKKFVQVKTARNLYLVKELVSLINLFESNEIPAIPYKGLVLAAGVYGGLSLRQFVDLDFLVPRNKYLKAQELLQAQGYYPPPQNNVDWEKTFVHNQKKIGVDLHQGLTPTDLPVYINFQRFWTRLQPVSIGGVEVKSFASEDLLIILCVQLAKDSQWTAEVLIKVCDIAELLRVDQELNWDIIWQQCVKLGTKRILLFSLYVVHEMLNTEIPDIIWQKMQQDDVAKQAALQVCQEFFLRSEESFRERIYQERIFLRKLARERWQDKVNYFFKTALTPNKEDFALFSLPKTLFFLYYLIRPTRLVLKFFKNMRS